MTPSAFHTANMKARQQPTYSSKTMHKKKTTESGAITQFSVKPNCFCSLLPRCPVVDFRGHAVQRVC